MKQVKDLKAISQEKLRKFVKYWELNDSNFSERYLDSLIDVETTGVGPLAGHFIHYAILIDDADLARDLCINGANVNKIDENWTKVAPLQLASDYGRSSIVKILLAYGAITEGIKANYSMNPCTQPLTFMWGIKERAQGRTVDYSEVFHLLNEPDSKSNRNPKFQ